jgi:hypothetical protein
MVHLLRLYLLKDFCLNCLGKSCVQSDTFSYNNETGSTVVLQANNLFSAGFGMVYTPKIIEISN